MLKAVIIDDESKAREGLHSILKLNFPEVEIIGEAANVMEGVKLINHAKPNIVFLDIEMPLYSGLELPDFFNRDQLTFNIIFTTAYTEHAIRAFRLSATDYLLKPIQISQLREAINKVKEKLNLPKDYSLLKQNYYNPETQKIAISLSEGLTIIELNKIVYLKAEGAYTHIVLEDHTKVVASKLLGDFDYLCEQHSFYRTHRSYIINIGKIKRISRQANDVVMVNNEEISITAERKSQLIERFKDIRL